MIAGLAPCHFCTRPTDLFTNFCYGCGAVVCDGCDTRDPEDVPWGDHVPEDHRDPISA